MLDKLRRLIAFFIDHWKFFFILGLASGGALTTILVCSLVSSALPAILSITIGGAAIFAPLWLVSPGVAIAVLALTTFVGILALGALAWTAYKTVSLFDRFAHWVYGIVKPKPEKNPEDVDPDSKNDHKMSCYQRISSTLGSLIPCFRNDEDEDEDEEKTKTQKTDIIPKNINTRSSGSAESIATNSSENILVNNENLLGNN